VFVANSKERNAKGQKGKEISAGRSAIKTGVWARYGRGSLFEMGKKRGD
jgi:hypothetical protein